MNSFHRTCLAALVAFCLSPLARAGTLSNHQGKWLGSMPIPNGSTIEVGVEMFARADGSAWASIAIPGQDMFDIPVTAVRETDTGATLDFNRARLDLTWDTDHFNGRFQETGGPVLAFPLRATDGFPRKALPQQPRPPFPHREESLAIRSGDNVTLGATLSIPGGVEHPNAVVLVHGAGPQTRDEDGTFLVLADYLARRGIAVLRYDKRGVARSTGSYENHTEAELAADLHAAIDALRNRHQFNRIGVIGHSEGPGIAALMARQDAHSMDFLVSLAGVGIPGLEMMVLQDRAAATLHAATPAEMTRMLAYSRQYYGAIIANPDPEKRVAALKTLETRRPPADIAVAKRLGLDGGSLSLEHGFAGKEFLRVMLMADAPRDWRSVRCPVLALNGSLDTQVPPESLAGIVTNLRAGGNTHVGSAVLPSLNHRFQTAKTGAEDEYSTLPETFAPGAMERVARFVLNQGNASNSPSQPRGAG